MTELADGRCGEARPAHDRLGRTLAAGKAEAGDFTHAATPALRAAKAPGSGLACAAFAVTQKSAGRRTEGFAVRRTERFAGH